MRTFLVVTLFGALATPTAAAPSLTPPSDAPYESLIDSGTPVPRDNRETLSGALHRADRNLDVVGRQTELHEQNYGANGRKNATRDAAEEAESPRAVQRGYSPWTNW